MLETRKIREKQTDKFLYLLYIFSTFYYPFTVYFVLYFSFLQFGVYRKLKTFLPFFFPTMCPKLIPKILLKLIFPTIAGLYSVYRAINKHFQNSNYIFHQINPSAIKVPCTYIVSRMQTEKNIFLFSLSVSFRKN